MKENRLLEINYLRALAIISVVAWHCFFCPIFIWPMDPKGVNTYYLPWIANTLLPNADMPLFTFISGYLFEFLYEDKGKYREFKPFLVSKLNRLMIPFLILSVLNVATSYHEQFIDIIWGGGSHLWYIAMLFWCFMIVWGLKKISWPILNVIVIGVSLYLILKYLNHGYMPLHLPLGIHNSLFYFSFFALGGGIYKYKVKIFAVLHPYSLLIAIAYLVISFFSGRGFPYVSQVANFIQYFLFLILIWLLCMILIRRRCLRESKLLNTFCVYGFGIYVFHHWIAWDLCWWPPFHALLIQHYLLVPALMFPILLVVSYYITKLAVRTRIGRFLLE